MPQEPIHQTRQDLPTNRSSEDTEQVKERAMDSANLVNQQLQRQANVEPDVIVDEPAMSPEMINEGENLRDDLKREA